MKFNMGLNMMDMVGVVEKRLSDIKFPFIVMHDPEDGKSSGRPEVVYLFFISCFSSVFILAGWGVCWRLKARTVLSLP